MYLHMAHMLGHGIVAACISCIRRGTFARICMVSLPLAYGLIVSGCWAINTPHIALVRHDEAAGVATAIAKGSSNPVEGANTVLLTFLFTVSRVAVATVHVCAHGM